MKPNSHNRFILLILFIVFATPTVLGIMLYQHPQWLQRRTINQGQLLTPTIPLTTLARAPSWRLIVWSPKACELVCTLQLEQLTRVRLALGRQFYHVRVTLLQPAANQSTTLNTLPVEQLTLDPADAQALQAFPDLTWFIADPQHALILNYPQPQTGEAIFHDLKHLLSINQTSEPAHVFKTN